MSSRKVIAVHQPNFNPWLGYFYKMSHCDVFVILDNVEYQSGNASSITNRTKIKTPQGEQMLAVPVRKGESKLIQDIVIDNKQPWAKKMLKSIQLSYAKAPFLNQYFPQIETMLNAGEEHLSKLNIDFIKLCAGWLNVTTPIVIASEMTLQSEDKNDRLIEICKQFDGNVYLSGNGAKKYNDEAKFNAAGITLEYTAYSPSPYKQLHGEFMPGLSCIDALMNCGEETAKFVL